MIPHLRQSFNKNFTEERYRHFLKRLDGVCGMHVDFRVSETPFFIPTPLIRLMVQSGKEIIMQLMGNREYLAASDKAIPHAFNVPNETPRPLFVAVDFGVIKTEDGSYVPKLIEMQGFPSLFGFQAALCQLYREAYGLSRELKYLFGGLTLEEYHSLLRRAILGDHVPDNVVLLELDPLKQKTRPDFVLTERICGICTVNIRDVVKQGRKLFYRRDGSLVPIHRIYNRAIADELMKADVELPFSFRDELDVEWAGHPNWFFRLSKFSLPHLNHPAVPRTRFLHQIKSLPDDLENWVLKPLFSFAGSGVVVGPSRAEIDAVPDARKPEYVLQERVEYGSFIETPHGGTKAEVRIMYIWLDELQPVNNLVRLGRGKMMGVNFNKNMAWVGSSAGFYLE